MAFAQQNLLDAIYNKLVAALPELPIYNGVADKDGAVPYVVYNLISDIPVIYMGTETDDFNVRLQVDVYANREYGSKNLRVIAEKIKSALHKQRLTITNAQANMWCLRRGDVQPEENNYDRIMQEYMILGSES